MALGGHRYLTFAALAENREFCAAVAQAGRKQPSPSSSPMPAGCAVGPGIALFTLAGGFLFGRGSAPPMPSLGQH